MIRLTYIALILILISCVDEIVFDLDKHESKLVVNSFFSPSDSIRINLSRSIPVLDKDTVNYVKNASVLIYCQDELVDKMNYDGNGNYSLNTSIVTGKEYSIIVDAPGFNTLTAKDMIPEPVQILSFDTITIDNGLLYCEIGFKNDLHAMNYYLLEIVSKYPVWDSDSSHSCQVDIINSDILVENVDFGNADKRLVFSGRNLQDSVYALGFVLDKLPLLNSCIDGSNTLYIQFKNISEKYYSYLKSYYSSQTWQDEVYTNAENGYGIFAGYSVTLDSIVIRNHP